MESGINHKLIRKITSSLIMVLAAVAAIAISNSQKPQVTQHEQSISIVTDDWSGKYKESMESLLNEYSEPKEAQVEAVEVSLLDSQPRTVAPVSEYDNQVLANVNESLNVRNEASTDAEIIGKMPKDAGGEILERANGFTKIKSGAVEGWVSDEYLIFGAEIEARAKELGLLKAEITTETLKIRQEADSEAPILELCGVGDSFTVLEEEGDWIKIQYASDQDGYIAAEYANVSIKLLTAITLEEEQSAIKAAEQKAAAKKVKDASNDQERYLLAACVMMEAGGYSYDGQLAVANVVLNRVRSGRWGNSITSVIYAQGQFPGAASGLLSKNLAKGPTQSALKAVDDAMNGVNNLGDYLFFNSVKAADYSSYSQYVVIDGNCFYKR